MAEAYLAAPAITAELGGIRLAPHQVDAASRLLALLGEWGGAVLADATGLGKTFVAIAVARVMGPALVIAPAALRNMWKESLTRAGRSGAEPPDDERQQEDRVKTQTASAEVR